MTTSVNQGRYVYHRVPPDLRGTVLYPLNRLKERFPDLYETLQQNYATRRDIAALRIPPLDNCLWNDVLFFSPIHPARFQSALAEAGHTLPSPWRRYYQINARLLNSASTVLYRSSETYWAGHFDVEKASVQIGLDCAPFDPELLDELGEVPQATRDHYASVTAEAAAQAGQAGTFPVLFLHTPHILYKGQLDTTIEGVSIVEV
jgi:hypothetical protein